MSGLATTLPYRWPDLVIRPLGDRGRYVVKDPRTGAFFTFGEQEHFLLMQLDGERDADAVCQAFAEHFGEPLSEADLDQFLDLARGKGLLLPDGAAPPPAAAPRSSPRSQQPTDLFRASCGATTPLELIVRGPGVEGGERRVFEQPFVLVGRHERN